MPLVVELEEGWTVGVVFFKVQVVHLGLLGRVTAVFTNVNLNQSRNFVNLKHFPRFESLILPLTSSACIHNCVPLRVL